MTNNSDEFKVVCKRKRNYKSHARSIDAKTEPLTEDEVDLAYTIKKLQSIRKEISISKFYLSSSTQLKQCLNLIHCTKINHLVCFGIGAIGNCLIALHQLAFILETIAEFKIPNVKFYDPILSDSEKSILQQFGCEILPENCEGKYHADSITVFYMPHCPKQLSNNLLWKNWNCKSLANIILIGNSFENMQRNTPERFLKTDAEFVLKSSKLVTEVQLENIFQFEDIFNDMSIHLFPKEKLEKVCESEWQDNFEPKYNDEELITAELEKSLNIK